MPHDALNQTLEKGDLVILQGVVQEVFPQEEACNCNVQITDITGCNEYAPIVTTNTQHLTKVYKPVGI